ncbi:MAG: flavin reductase family protein [Hyphomicrobium sp.]|nr:flavin reductase family protein [Hyphomicrobium sp.]
MPSATAVASPRNRENETSASLDAQQFKSALAEFPAAVTAVTCWNDLGEPTGATLSAVCSLSLDPPLMLACFDRSSSTLKALSQEGKRLLIHLLAQGQEAAAVKLSGKGNDKFSELNWAPTEFGPRLEGACRTFECEVDALLTAGDHVIVAALVHKIEETVHQPLLYHRRELYAVPAKNALR